MTRFLVVATGGAGGDLQPLVAAALALRRRGHATSFVGDRAVEAALQDQEVDVNVLRPELDLGPRLARAVRESMAIAGDLDEAGLIVQERLAQWAQEVAVPVSEIVRREKPDAVVTSLFGVEAIETVGPPCPWAVINSTFYVGPNPPRPPEEDFGTRALPLIERYASLLGAADLVLHATDQVFDLSFDRLPAHHRYVGPLGTWEPPGVTPAYLDQSGHPWVLVSISSQAQDDLPVAVAALAALEHRPVRVILTLGPHDPSELTHTPANARVEPSIPHSAILERGVLSISHAGHGSVMKGLWYGTPMVLVPWGRDQPGVAARAQALGVAAIVSRGEAMAQELADAVGRVLDGEPMRAAVQSHAARLRATDPPRVAAELLEELASLRQR